MKRRTGRLLLTLLACIAGNELSFARDSLNVHGFLPAEARFRLVNDYLMVAPVMVNGYGPYDMVIDTGSSLSFIDAQVASEIGLKEIDTVDVYALFGVDHLKSSVANFEFAGKQFEETGVAIQNLAMLKQMDSKIRGILGWNVLWKFNFLIDYSRHRLEIHETSEATEVSGKRVPYVRRAGLALVPAVIRNLSNRELQLILDSGARSVVLYAKHLPLAVALGEQELRHSTIATAKVHVVHVPNMTVGAHPVSEVAVELLVGTEDRQFHLEDGVLPIRLFSSVYFDNSENCVVLNPHIRKK
jgi:hypothetical protein